MKSTLYLVAMPIGNLDDVTHRAVQTLASVDYVIAEDTRTSARVLERYGVSTPFFSSIYEGAEQQRVESILAVLSSGKTLALVSDAGTPLVSDPGFPLVRAAIEAGHRIVPVPGPCAAIAGIIASGLPLDRFYFGGSLPRGREARKNVLGSLSQRGETSIFYESCHRILDTLEILASALPERRVVLARELTKVHEEFHRGTAEEIHREMADATSIRGEWVLVIEGAEAPPSMDELAARRVTAMLRSEGVSSKRIQRILVEALGVSRNDAYRWVHLNAA